MSPFNPEKLFMNLAEVLGEDPIERIVDGADKVRLAVANEFDIHPVQPSERHDFYAEDTEQLQPNPEADLSDNAGYIDAISNPEPNSLPDEAQQLARINRIHASNPPQINNDIVPNDDFAQAA